MTDLNVLRAEEFAADQREAESARLRERGDGYKSPANLRPHIVVRGNVLWDDFRQEPVQHGPSLCMWAVLDAAFAPIYVAYGEAARSECGVCGAWPGHYCTDRFGHPLDVPHYYRRRTAA